MRKRIFSFFLAVCMLISVLPLPASAAAVSGTCGEDLTWVLTDDGTQVRSGTGDMEDYTWNVSPWYDYREQISAVVIESGVTSIGRDAFYSCTSLTSIDIPASVTSIWAEAFFGCTNLNTITFHGNAPTFGGHGFAFGDVTATAYYPANNETWTEDMMQDYGGTLTWAPFSELEIVIQPQSVTVAEGEYAIVTVEAQGDGLTYELYFSDNGGEKFYKTSAYTTATYKIAMNEARNGRMLYCVITDENGNSLTTDVVTISMSE